MGWIKDIAAPGSRLWEELYRNRAQYDAAVRSTHGVNCTGGCSWNVFVKDGIVTWETQATDYPPLEPSLPPYEPRGCQRGISTSWYVYSPLRVKYPYVRGALLDLWRRARKRHPDPVQAWGSLVEDETARAAWQAARGRGGFRRAAWDECLEIVAASCLYTAKRWGPDRVFGFSPIPAMSYFSYAGGARFLELFGGAVQSFYDWYADLPNAFPEIWGDQTDVCESADWFNSRYIVSMGSNLSMTRTPDVHFVVEARHEGAKFVVLAPDFSQVSKYADWWIPLAAGTDTALWMAVDHVILREFSAERRVPYFVDYLTRYTDAPFLVRLEPRDGGYRPGQLLRASQVQRYAAAENAEWKTLVWDGGPRMPKGTVGFRWGSQKGRWNLRMEDGLDDSPLSPALSFLEDRMDVVPVLFDDFSTARVMSRGVPVRFVETSSGRVTVTTVFDLLMAEFGVGRGLPGHYPAGSDDPVPFTPAWQESHTGIGRDSVIRLAREFAHNAEVTQGRSMIIIGSGVNHWFSNNLGYRAPATALMLCGCCGRNGGGLNHYVGQEKVAAFAPWRAITFAFDWQKPPRQQQTPIWHYVHSDQWRYEGDFTDYFAVPARARWAKGHCVDQVAKAVRMGWMPFYPQFDRNPLAVAREAREAGALSAAEVASWAARQLQENKLSFAVNDPDAPESFPRVWLIWRANALFASGKGHEYMLRHYLGARDGTVAAEKASGSARTVRIREPAPRGKMDLVVDLNFRMDTSALYSDIVLPAAMWYEKNDLNTTDMHSFVHNIGAAVPPSWEAKSDWEIFKALARRVSELAPSVFPGPVEDLVASPLMHDTPDEISQPQVLDWAAGECEPVPGRTMPYLRIVERDYASLYDKFVSLGPLVPRDGIACNGVTLPMEKFYEELLKNPAGGTPDPWHRRCVEWNGRKYPSLEDTLDAANALLYLAPETNGEVAYEGFLHEEEKTGVPLADLAQRGRAVPLCFGDLMRQPRRILTSPCWSGIVANGRAYAAWCMNVERLVPWRTLTGRQHFYLDHPHYIDFGEHLPTFKPKLDRERLNELAAETGAEEEDGGMVLNFLTPHGKWQIHSTFSDNIRMLTLSRGISPCWISEKDATAMGVADNDWVELTNDNGVMVTRAAVSSRVQPGTCMVYHSPERTYLPRARARGDRRSGGHNSLTRVRLNPVQLAGGYAQFTWFFNYWGPIGSNRDTWVRVRRIERPDW
jgi:nitrate reductase alpha subunit